MASPANVVGFVGFDDMSLELAASLVRSGYAVQAFDSQVQFNLIDFMFWTIKWLSIPMYLIILLLNISIEIMGMLLYVGKEMGC